MERSRPRLRRDTDGVSDDRRRSEGWNGLYQGTSLLVPGSIKKIGALAPVVVVPGGSYERSVELDRVLGSTG